MSVINPFQIGSGISPASGGFDLENSAGNGLERTPARATLGNDTVRLEPPVRMPIFPRQPLPSPVGYDGGGGLQNGGSFAGLSAMIEALVDRLSSIFETLASLLGSALGNVTGAPPGAAGQQLFARATASSTGDPHEAFHGATPDGIHVDGTWDSMSSHADLLSSDSVAGGYRISNAVTQPRANGVTLNARVDVATDDGRTNVGMNADGSYDVSQFGRRVDLVEGRAVRIDEHESVTLNADRSITIQENARDGGAISTTLRSNGSGGVDVSNDATNVDLGGYLVTKNDDDTGTLYSFDASTSRPSESGYVARPFEPDRR